MPVPERIGRLRVMDQIGAGGFATVWRAYDEELDASVAIKILSENWLTSADVRRRFLAEAQMLRRVDSDRLVRVHDLGELPDGRPYFVMTYADRGTLADRLTHGALPWQTAVRTAIEICEALRVLHRADVLHRDIKPSNVLFCSEPDGSERTLLGDLGLGKRLSEASGITQVGGTPAYRAPEQSRPGAPLGVFTDIYGAGAVLYHALTGTCPNGTALSAGNASGGPASLRTVMTDALPELDNVVRRALAKDPSRRQPDVSTLLDDLRRVRGIHRFGDPPRAAPAMPSAKPRPWWRRRWRWLAAAVLIMLVTAAGTPMVLRPMTTLEVKDDGGKVTVRVPRDWATQVTGSAWDPALLSGSTGEQPGVLVSASVAQYDEITDERPGVFVGLLPSDLQLSADMFRSRVQQAACDLVNPPEVADALIVVRHRCGDVVVDDVLLRRAGQRAWVQVKQPSDQVDHTGDVVASVSLPPS